jgi:hypothetical protein
MKWSWWLLMFSNNPSQTFLVSGETFVNKTFAFHLLSMQLEPQEERVRDRGRVEREKDGDSRVVRRRKEFVCMK